MGQGQEAEVNVELNVVEAAGVQSPEQTGEQEDHHHTDAGGEGESPSQVRGGAAETPEEPEVKQACGREKQEKGQHENPVVRVVEGERQEGYPTQTQEADKGGEASGAPPRTQ